MTQAYRNLNPRPALIAILGLVGLVLAAGGPAKADAFRVTYEAPGIQSANSTALCATAGTGTCTVGVESFDTRTTNTAFTTKFGTGQAITGAYSATQINAADQYGGAGGTGKYAVAFGATPFSVALSTTLKTGLNYFGFWLSALDAGNQVGFYKSNVLLYSFTPTKLITDLGACANGNKYCGNPTAQFIGQNNQQYAFVNFFDTNGNSQAPPRSS
jgi:hypothetical protein